MATAEPGRGVRIQVPDEEGGTQDMDDEETGPLQRDMSNFSAASGPLRDISYVSGHDLEDVVEDEATPLISKASEETGPTISKTSTCSSRRRPALLEANDSEDEMTFTKTYKTVLGELLGNTGRFDWIVEADAFQDYPRALLWARLTQILLSMIVFISFGVMIVYYCMGVIQTEREYYWYSGIEVPILVVCPDMNSMSHQPTRSLRTSRHGSLTNFSVMAAMMDTYPDSMNPRPLEYKVGECVESAGCRCIEFPEGTTFLRRDNRTDMVRVVFRTTTDAKSYLFGFHRNRKAHKDEVPHTFAYGSFGMKVLGYVTLRLVDRKAEKIGGFFESMALHKLMDKHIYDWAIGGLAVPSEDRFDTEIVFGMRSFQVARDQTFTGVFSPFAILTVLAVCMSILNNLNVFGLMFPVQDHPVFTQREPALFFRSLCSCFRCVQRRTRNLQKQTRLEKLLTEHQEQLRHVHMAPKQKKRSRGWSRSSDRGRRSL